MTTVESKNIHVPNHYDFVGSFLRPAALKIARHKFSKSEISAAELKIIEDTAIIDLIQKQKELGLKSITDGEFRRSWWHLDFMWGLGGVKKVDLDTGYQFHGIETRAETACLTGNLNGANHPFVEHFKFVNQYADETVLARQTIPAPAQFLAELQRKENRSITQEIYPNSEDLITDIAAAYKTVLKDLYNAGCRNIQLDDCTWGMFCDKKYWEARQESQISLTELAALYAKVNNLAISDRPADLIITTHVCRGNYHSSWAASGGYEPIANILFKENVDAFYLEYDSDRAGDFAPLRFITTQKVVLGLITSKTSKLENKNSIKERITEATNYVPLNQLCLSPQCGFASTEEGNLLTEDQQWNKMKLVKEIAEEVWHL